MAPALLHLNSTATGIMARATSASTETVLDRAQFQIKNQNGRVLVLGSTGRVGGSTAVALYNLNLYIYTLFFLLFGFRKNARNKGGKFFKLCYVSLILSFVW